MFRYLINHLTYMRNTFEIMYEYNRFKTHRYLIKNSSSVFIFIRVLRVGIYYVLIGFLFIQYENTLILRLSLLILRSIPSDS